MQKKQKVRNKTNFFGVITLLLFFNFISVAFAQEFQWPTPGAPADQTVTNQSGAEWNHRVVRTSDNHYIVTWIHNPGATNIDIFAQKFNGTTGATMWAGPTTVVNANNQQPYIFTGFQHYALVADASGGAYIAWDDNRAGGTSNTDIYVQHLNSSGVPQWTTNGVQIQVDGTAATLNENNPYIMPDGAGNIYVAWSTRNSSQQGNRPYITRVTSGGAIDATFNGGTPLRVDDTGNTTYPWRQVHGIVSDGSGGAIVHYVGQSDIQPSQNGRGQIYATHITSTATKPWQHVQVSNGDDARDVFFKSVSTSDGSGGVIIAFYHIDFTDFNGPLSVQRINSAGTAQWSPTPVLSEINSTFAQITDIIGDGSGGAYIAFEKSAASVQVFIQHVDSTGAAQFTTNGLQVSNGLSGVALSTQNTFGSQLADGSAIVAWQECIGNCGEANEEKVVKLRKITDNGTILWTYGDNQLSSTTLGQDREPFIVSTGDGEVVVSWIGQPLVGGDEDIFIQRIDSTLSCNGIGAGGFCGSQTIASSTLTFQDIPDSFNFGTITEGSSQDLFNNENLPGPNAPAADDLLQVLDDRNSGGFTLTVDPEGTFIEETATYTIPLTDLYIITSLDETDPGNVSGVTYGAGFTGDQTVSAPLYVDVDSVSLTNTASYTGLAPGSQFGGSPLVLMNGTLSSGSGRNGTMSMFTNFYLNIDPNQQEGSYALKLTYTLTDSTT